MPFAVGAGGVLVAIVVLAAHRADVVEQPAETDPLDTAYALTAEEAA